MIQHIGGGGVREIEEKWGERKVSTQLTFRLVPL